MDMQTVINKLQDNQFRRSLTNLVLAAAAFAAGLGYVFDIEYLKWFLEYGLTGGIAVVQMYLSLTNMKSNRVQKELLQEKTNVEKISDIVNGK